MARAWGAAVIGAALFGGMMPVATANAAPQELLSVSAEQHTRSLDGCDALTAVEGRCDTAPGEQAHILVRRAAVPGPGPAVIEFDDVIGTDGSARVRPERLRELRQACEDARKTSRRSDPVECIESGEWMQVHEAPEGGTPPSVP